MHRLIALFSVFLLLCSYAAAEDTPQTLRTVTSIEEATQFLLLPAEEDVICDVLPGHIRYVSQLEERDPAFRTAYWYSTDEDALFDLTREDRNGYDFGFHVKVMCTRAAYSMALSYLGINMTPGAMSAVTGERNLDVPYDMISALVGVERVVPEANVFNTMMDSYLTDEHYSPVYLYIQKPNGTYHALLVIGYMPDTHRYIVVDSNPYYAYNEPYRVYFISLNTMRTQIINSTFRKELAGSKVLQLYQWRLTEDASAAQAD